MTNMFHGQSEQWGTPGHVSDAGMMPPPLTEAQWQDHLDAYWRRVQSALAEGERPLRTSIERGEVDGQYIKFPDGPFIGPDAIVPAPGTDPGWGHAGYTIDSDAENENPGFHHRPYLIPSDPADQPVPLPFGFTEGDEHEAAAIVRTWIIERVTRGTASVR